MVYRKTSDRSHVPVRSQISDRSLEDIADSIHLQKQRAIMSFDAVHLAGFKMVSANPAENAAKCRKSYDLKYKLDNFYMF